MDKIKTLISSDYFIGFMIGSAATKFPGLAMVIFAAMGFWLTFSRLLDAACDWYLEYCDRRDGREKPSARLDMTAVGPIVKDYARTMADQITTPYPYAPTSPLLQDRQAENAETVRRVELFDERPWETLRRIDPTRDKTLGEILRMREGNSTK